jgi:hypothetical protein
MYIFPVQQLEFKPQLHKKACYNLRARYKRGTTLIANTDMTGYIGNMCAVFSLETLAQDPRERERD